MPFYSELLDPYSDEYDTPGARGPYQRTHVSVGEDVGREAIKSVQPELEGRSVLGFGENLVEGAGKFAAGFGALLLQPIVHPVRTAQALQQAALHPIDTAKDIFVDPYVEKYTPQDQETVPQMLMRNFYDDPFGTLMDASAVAQLATGGLGLAARAAGAERTAGLLKEVGARAAKIDPITLGMGAAEMGLKKFKPDLLARMRVTSHATDAMAERTAQLRFAEDEAKRKTQEAFGHLNTAELGVIRPYIEGRFAADDWGQRILERTGEWVPLKGQGIRPEALEQARQNYIPIRDEFEMLSGYNTEHVAEVAGRTALKEAKDSLGDQFDPLRPDVEAHVKKRVSEEIALAEQAKQTRETVSTRTALDVAKDKAWKKHLEELHGADAIAQAEDLEKFGPRPERTSYKEALAAMGPQGGIYFPHSGEVLTREQSTIGNLLTKLGEASVYKENTGAMFAAGIVDQQDPIKAILNTYGQFAEGNTFVQMAHDAVEAGSKIKGSGIQVAPKGWRPNVDPDVVAGTHQPFHPAMLSLDDFMEEHGQRLVSRLLEVDGDAGAANIMDLMDGIAKNAAEFYKVRGDAPMYKIPTEVGHALSELKNKMQPATHPFMRSLDNVTQWWNWFNLNTKGTRLANNVIGNTGMAAMMGVHPFSGRGMQAMISAGRAMLGKAGVLTDQYSQDLAKVFELPGMSSGLQTSLTRDFGATGTKLIESGNPLAKGLGYWGHYLERANSNAEAFFRAAGLFHELTPGIATTARRMFTDVGETMSLADRVSQFRDMGAGALKSPEYGRSLKAVNRFFHNYDRTTPFESQVIRRLFPYYKFYKHSVELVTRFPFEHPLRGQVARQIGNAALRDTKALLKSYGLSWEKDVPESMQDSIPLYRDDGPDGKPVVWMFNTKGPNPFSAVSGKMAEETLNMLNPVVKVLLEQTTGMNFFQRERYRGAISSFVGREVDPKTGRIVENFDHPSFPEAFLRQFWPYQMAREWAANGRVPTDTASLLQMVTNDPQAWQMGERGFEKRRPRKTGAQMLTRLVGPVPSAVEPASAKTKQSNKAIVNEQLNNLLQRYPEHRAAIMSEIVNAGRRVARRKALGLDEDAE